MTDISIYTHTHLYTHTHTSNGREGKTLAEALRSADKHVNSEWDFGAEHFSQEDWIVCVLRLRMS